MRRGQWWAHACWFGHALGWTRNPLRRGVDRVVAVLTAALLAVALLAVPFAATWGSMSYERGLAVAEREAVSRHEVEAITTGPAENRVVGSAPRGVQIVQTWAPVSWTGRDGSPRTDSVQVDSNRTVGERVPLWVDDGDRVTGPPRTSEQVILAAWTNGTTAWLMVVTGCAVLLAGVRGIAGGVAGRKWEQEWALVEPAWTQRQK